MSDFLQRLRQRAAQSPRRIAFPECADARTLEAIATLQQEGLARCIVVGESALLDTLSRSGALAAGTELQPLDAALRTDLEQHLVRRRAARGMTPAGARVALDDPLLFASCMVGVGRADGFVAGATCPTGDVIRAALWGIGLVPGQDTLSSAFYMVVPPFRSAESEVLTFTDAGVVPEPTAEQLSDIAAAAVQARRLIVGDEPRVAFLSYSTEGSADGPAVQRVRQATALFQRRFPEVPAGGELQADAALIASVAARKAPASPVAGSANVLVFPGLDAANIAYKLVQWLGGAQAIGPILQGLAAPANDLSRGASRDDIVNVACVTALQAGASAPNLPLREVRK